MKYVFYEIIIVWNEFETCFEEILTLFHQLRMFHNFWNKIIGSKLRIPWGRIIKTNSIWKVKRYHFRICNWLISNINPKFQEEPQMSAFQLKALLNAACKVYNLSTFLLGDRLNLRLRWWGNRRSTFFKSNMSFRILDQLENLIPVWKCLEISLTSVSCLNNLERFYLAFNNSRSKQPTNQPII